VLATGVSLAAKKTGNNAIAQIVANFKTRFIGQDQRLQKGRLTKRLIFKSLLNYKIIRHGKRGLRPAANRDVEQLRTKCRVQEQKVDDVNLARAADGIDAMSLAVVEDIIGIAGDADAGNYVARFGV